MAGAAAVAVSVMAVPVQAQKYKFNMTSYVPLKSGTWNNYMQRFIDGRAGVARGLAARLGAANAEVRAEAAGRIWARADLAAYASEDGERDRALDQERGAARAEGQLPAALRPLAVIEGLARRSLRAGGGPMLGDRLSPLVALRLGLFGR